MKKIWILTRNLFKSNSAILSNFKDSHLSISSFLFAFICMLGCIWSFIGNETSMLFKGLRIVGCEELIIYLLLIIVTSISLISSIIYILSLLYFSNDIEALLPLPLNSVEVAISKLVIVLFYEYIINFLYYIPIIAVYGYQASKGVLYYLYGIVIFLLLPIVPITIVSVIIIAVMRVVNANKNKHLFKVITIGTIFIIFLIISYIIKSSYGEIINNSNLNAADDICNKVYGYMMYLKYPCNVLADSSFLSLFIFIITNIGAVSILSLVVQKFYLNTITDNCETNSKDRMIKDNILRKELRKSSQFKTYVLNELRYIVRCPNFLINCILKNFIWVALIIIIFSIDESTSNQLSFIRNIIYNDNIMKIAFMLLLAFLFFYSRYNLSAFISISKYGKKAYFQKCLPISYSKQIWAKVMVSSFIQSITLVINLLCIVHFFNLPSIIVMYTIIEVPFMIFYGAVTAVFRDIKNPDIEWENEVEIVKNNTNFIFTIIFTLIEIAIFIFIAKNTNCSFNQIFGITLILFMILDLILIKRINSNGKRYFEDILN